MIDLAKRFILVFSPFFVLLAAFLLLQLFAPGVFSTKSHQFNFPEPTTIVIVTAFDASPTPGVLPASSPTPGDQIALESATPTSFPTLDPLAITSQIELMGPPAGSDLPPDVPVTFYWKASQKPAKGMVFVLILITSEGRKRIATLSEPNLGQDYRAVLIPAEFATAQVVAWQVQLESLESGVLVGQSEQRPIQFHKDES